MDRRQRLRDGLVGAAVALLVVVLLGAVLLWWVSSPAGSGSAGTPAPPPTSSPRADVPAPADLADGETWLTGVRLDASTLVTPDTTLHDVSGVGQDVRATADGLVIGEVEVEATVPFDVVAEQLGPGTTVRAAGNGGAAVERSVTVLGRRVDVVATGSVEAVDGLLVVEPRTIDVGGPSLLSAALGALVRNLVTIEQEVHGLPEGLVLRDVGVREDGFRARLSGEDVVLVQSGGGPPAR